MRLEVQVQDELLDGGQLDLETNQLQSRLRDLDVEVSRPVEGGQTPGGARGDGVTVGALVVALSSSSVLVALVQEIADWVRSNRSRKVRLRLGDDELELDGLSSSEQRQLMRSWLDRHR
jgi:hypothetical protein